MKQNDVVFLVDEDYFDEQLQELADLAEEHGAEVKVVPHELFLMYTDILSRGDEDAPDHDNETDSGSVQGEGERTSTPR